MIKNLSLDFLVECINLIFNVPGDKNDIFMEDAMKFICHAVLKFKKKCPEKFSYSKFKINIDIKEYLKENKNLYSVLFGLEISDIESFNIIAHNISTYLNSFGNVTDSHQFGMNPFDPTIDFSTLPPRIPFMSQPNNNNNNNYELNN